MQPATPPRPWQTRLQSYARKSVAVTFVVAALLSVIANVPPVVRLVMALLDWLRHLLVH